jgi:tRNA threonylcarbamoyladenosine biosynthesis protein TsaB
MSRPPLVLGLDTSHQRGSVSVSRGPEPVAEILFDASDTHSATLMPAVDSVLRSAKTALSDIDLMAVVIGPGSFTGLRIGLATVKAFAAVRGAGVVPVPSLEVLAAAFPFARQLVAPLIDARRGEVYGALYGTEDGAPREVAPFFSSRPETLGAVLERHSVSTPLILCGTGALRYGGLLLDLAPRGSVLAGARWAVPSASLCSFLALERAPLSREELFALEPLYVRPPDARLPDTSRLRVRRDGGS